MQSVSDLTITEATIREACGDPTLPELGLIEQRWDTDPIPDDDIATHVDAAVEQLPWEGVPNGGTVALGVGSRGIDRLPILVRETVSAVQDRGYDPVVVTAMGSHAGATAAGQTAMLAELGVTPETAGCEIEAGMDVVEVGRTPEREVPVVTDAIAADADAIIPLNRVKPHTDYEGAIESGLAKMLVIGFGNQRGAKIAHEWAIDWSLSEMVPEIAAQLLESLPVLGGIAIVEDQHDSVTEIHGVPSATLLECERTLLERATELMPRLPFDDIDVLVLDRQGKNISGQGLDPNVTGRRPFAINEPEPVGPTIKRIYTRNLTPETHGNAMGMGSADFVHGDLVASLEPTDTVVNALTAGTVRGVRLPVALASDRAALIAATSTVGVASAASLRLVRATDTSHLDRLYVSESLVEAARSRSDLAVVAEPAPISYDDEGNFIAPSPTATTDDHTL